MASALALRISAATCWTRPLSCSCLATSSGFTPALIGSHADLLLHVFLGDLDLEQVSHGLVDEVATEIFFDFSLQLIFVDFCIWLFLFIGLNLCFFLLGYVG